MATGFGLDPVPGLNRLTPDTAHLKVLNGPKANHCFPLHQIRNVIGRSDPPHIIVDLDLSDCEFSEPPMISRRHALLQWINGELQMIDLASRNGTFVNDQRLAAPGSKEPSAPVTLKVGNKLRLGNLEFEVMS